MQRCAQRRLGQQEQAAALDDAIDDGARQVLVVQAPGPKPLDLSWTTSTILNAVSLAMQCLPVGFETGRTMTVFGR